MGLKLRQPDSPPRSADAKPLMKEQSPSPCPSPSQASTEDDQVLISQLREQLDAQTQKLEEYQKLTHQRGVQFKSLSSKLSEQDVQYRELFEKFAALSQEHK